MTALPTAWSGRCSPGGATTVLHAPAARASAIVTCATWPSRARASSSVPATLNAKSLRVRSRMPSPGGIRQLKQSPRSLTWAAVRAKRSRSKVRSTIVATHQPVIASLRSSNRPSLIGRSLRAAALHAAGTASSRSSAARLEAASAAGGSAPSSRASPSSRARAPANARAASATRSVDGASSRRPCSAAIDVDVEAGHPARVDELEVREGRRPR